MIWLLLLLCAANFLVLVGVAVFLVLDTKVLLHDLGEDSEPWRPPGGSKPMGL